MKRTPANHSVIFILFMGGAVIVVIATTTLFGMVLPQSDPESRALAQLISLITWILSWVLRGLYISNRDLRVDDMGPVALRTYIGVCEGVYRNKYMKAEKDE